MTTSTTVFNDADECRNCGARYDQHAIITELCMTGDNCFVPVINGDDELARLQGELLHSNGDLARLRADLQTVTNSRDSYNVTRKYDRGGNAARTDGQVRPGGEVNDYAVPRHRHDFCSQFDQAWPTGIVDPQPRCDRSCGSRNRWRDTLRVSAVTVVYADGLRPATTRTQSTRQASGPNSREQRYVAATATMTDYDVTTLSAGDGMISLPDRFWLVAYPRQPQATRAASTARGRRASDNRCGTASPAA